MQVCCILGNWKHTCLILRKTHKKTLNIKVNRRESIVLSQHSSKILCLAFKKYLEYNSSQPNTSSVFSSILWALFRCLSFNVHQYSNVYSRFGRRQSFRTFFFPFSLLRQQPWEDSFCSLVSWHSTEVPWGPFPIRAMETPWPWSLRTPSLEVSYTYHAFKLRQMSQL